VISHPFSKDDKIRSLCSSTKSARAALQYNVTIALGYMCQCRDDGMTAVPYHTVGRGSRGLRSWKGPWLFSLSEFGPHEQMRITRCRPGGGRSCGYFKLHVLGEQVHCSWFATLQIQSTVCTYVQRFCNTALVPTITTDSSTSPPGSSVQSCNPGVLPVSLISISRFLERLFPCCINLMLFAGPECYAALGNISSADGAGRPQSPVLCSDTKNV
jgi:hypothetical protein